jgi:hypothetical protein
MADTLELQVTASAAVPHGDRGLSLLSYAPDGPASAPRTPMLGFHTRVLIGSAVSQLPIWGKYKYSI